MDREFCQFLLSILPLLAIPSGERLFREARTVGGTLGDGLLAATAADAHTVDDIALLGLVTEAAGLVRARRARGAVDDVQLTELYSCTLSICSTSV